MDQELAFAQALRYAEELRTVYAEERAQRRAAEEALERVEASYRLTVRALAAALELRDGQTGDHAERVTALALQLTERVAPELLADPQLEYGFLLHDLGKIGVPDGILLKPGALDDAEFEAIRRHPRFGADLLEGIPYLNGLARDVVLFHHERWDGAGYPGRLSATDIPRAARVFAVVDAYDAMTADRPYRRGLPAETALARLRDGSGSQFDPELVEKFARLAAELGLVPARRPARSRPPGADGRRGRRRPAGSPARRGSPD